MTLAKRIHQAAHLIGEFRLRSGRVSDIYFDKYAFESDPILLGEITDALARLLPEDFDALAGLELGGVPLATMLSARTGRPTRFVRKAAKRYGTERLAEGGTVEGLRLVVVEDVVTSGGQIVESVRELRDRGAVVNVAVCVIDREAGGREVTAAEGVELRALFKATELTGV